MKNNNRQNKRKLNKAILVFIIIVIFAILIEAQITWMLTKNSAEKSTDLLLNQIETVLDNNEKEEKDRTEELKETYISYAQTVAYILDAKPEAINNIDELKEIAKLQQIDEIHIFDESGTIFSGTVPKYYGYSFDSGEQMGYFKPMLKDKTFTMCQDITPNTAEGKYMMYAIVWNQKGTRMIQVGIEPKRLLNVLQENDIANVLDNLPLTGGFDICVFDRDTQEFVTGTNERDLSDTTLSSYTGIRDTKKNQSGSNIIRKNGKFYFRNFRPINGYIVAVSYFMNHSAASMIVPLLIIALYLIITGAGILHLFVKLYNAEKRQNMLNKDLLKATERAEEANKAKTNFLFNMSHDIRTPMNAIIGFTDLIEKHYDDKEKCMDYIHKTQDANRFLLSLINNVLEMARIESGNVTLNEESCDIGEFNNDLYSVFEEQMKQKNISFTKKMDVQHQCVFCDPVKLREIFLNIVSNAYKYTPEGGKVSMVLKELPSDQEGYALFETTIADNGIGMDQDFLPHLFEEFSRAKSSTDSRIEGTGLGMPIVKEYVELMGGTIQVESEPGKGSTFVVTIHHRIADESGSKKINNAFCDRKSFAGKRILLAEDNDLNAEIAEEILSEAGFKVERAADGIICVDMLKKAAADYYDMILMDIQMPNMDGYQTSRMIRSLKDPVLSRIPIIAMTANAFESDKQNAMDAGMDGHVAKPIEIPKLIEALAEILK